MRKSGVFSVMVLCAGLVTGQPTFMEIFRATGTAQVDLNEMSSGNLRIGMARQSGTSLINSIGEIIQSHNYAVDSFLVLQSFKRATDSIFYFVGGYYKDTCTVAGLGTITMIYPVIGQMDSLGNVITAKHYALNGPACTGEALGSTACIARRTWIFLRVEPTRTPILRKQNMISIQLQSYLRHSQ